MLKFLVVSDAHGKLDLLDDIFYKNQGCNCYLNLGDSCLPPSLNNYTSIRGNCDYYDYPISLDIPIEYGSIHMQHKLDYNAKVKNDCLIYLYGHTHIKKAEFRNGILYLNPGSISSSRDESMPSYAIITIDDKRNITYEFKEIKI